MDRKKLTEESHNRDLQTMREYYMKRDPSTRYSLFNRLCRFLKPKQLHEFLYGPPIPKKKKRKRV